MSKKEVRTLKQMLGKADFFTRNIAKDFDIMIERKDNQYLSTIYTYGGKNKCDITELVKLSDDTDIDKLDEIVCYELIKHYLFNDELNEVCVKGEQPNLLKHYDLIQIINNLITEYGNVSNDTYFEKVDPMIYEYIDDRLSEMETSEFPINTYKKWDDLDKLLKLRNKIMKAIKDSKKN